MKKRIVFPLFLLLLAGGTAAAQNWQEALKQAATAVGDKATDGKLTQYALPGTWTYSAPGVRFEGEDAAADLGAALLVPAISEQLAKLYLAAGIQPGSSTVTFDREGGFTAAFGRQKLTGSYEYDAGSHPVSVRPSDEKLEKIGAVSGRAYVSGSELQLLFPVTKLLELAKDVSSQAASLEAASALLANYKNLYIGFSFKK